MCTYQPFFFFERGKKTDLLHLMAGILTRPLLLCSPSLAVYFNKSRLQRGIGNGVEAWSRLPSQRSERGWEREDWYSYYMAEVGRF